MSRRRLLRALPVCCLLCVFACLGARAETADDDLSMASLENLVQMKISVSSFARKDEDLWKTPAAVFVITREDIERSAATSIPELLRMVPGVQVAQINASSWAVSARGFNSLYAYKLLVLIDGRTVYSEIYSGAHWDQIDLPLDEIERVEVVRGPGATAWGTNAVNGVINIITRRARSTAGMAASARVGRIDEATTLHYGGSIGDRVQYRGYANYTNRQPLELATGRDAFDGEDSVRGGFRIDWQRSREDWITLSGDLYGGHFNQQILSEFPAGPEGHNAGSIAGGFLLSRWEHKLSHADTALQIYFDDTSRHELTSYPRTRTFDVDFQEHLAPGERNDVVWGGELRLSADHIGGAMPLILKPDYGNYLVDGFVQDEITLVQDRLVLSLGSKIQNGTRAGFQVQPSARLLWSPRSTQSLWAAVSRAVVSPSIQDTAIDIPLNLGSANGLPITGTLMGNPHFQPETVLALEAGYRQRLGSHFTLDAASFLNKYRRVQSLVIAPPAFVPTPSPHLYVELGYGNGYRTHSEGVEAALSWKPRTTLAFQASYTWVEAHNTQVVAGNQGLADSWSSPRNTVAASGFWSFARGWNVNSSLFFVDALPRDLSFSLSGGDVGRVPAYIRLDTHVVHKIGHSFEFDAGGTNLLSPRHVEFGGGTAEIVPSYVPRSLFLKLKWAF